MTALSSVPWERAAQNVGGPVMLFLGILTAGQ
jgi:hypothetical protein